LGLVQAFALSQILQERANLLLITPGLDNPLHEEASDDRTEQEVLAPIRDVVKENNLWGKISAFAKNYLALIDRSCPYIKRTYQPVA